MRSLLVYCAILIAAIAAFAAIDAWGQYLVAPQAAAPTANDTAHPVGSANAIVHVLLTLMAVVALGLVLGQAFRTLGQPPVIGEVVAGIVLGPSLLGRLSPEASNFLLPPAVAPFLGVIAQVGVIIYMFLVGLELNLHSLRDRRQSTILISHLGIVVPFVLGAALALFLYPRLSSDDVPFTSFALFLGAAMAITAFPVLARILTDRGMTKTPLGVVALACAALDDATAWCLLAFVVGVAQAKLSGAFVVIGLTVFYIAVMFLIVRPLAAHFLVGRQLTRGTTAVIFVALLLSALATEFIGIHAIFGAFLLGAVIPHDSAVAQGFTHKLEDFVTVLLLPAFFAYTGLRTQIGLVASGEEWLICALVIAVATLGKFGGILLAARMTGINWRHSAALGILMNTRGLMELIVLNIGLDLKIISPTLFAMMVLMALATTIATTPLLQVLGVGDGR
jgi:Kef-type K+ transport system membrane component KefB